MAYLGRHGIEVRALVRARRPAARALLRAYHVVAWELSLAGGVSDQVRASDVAADADVVAWIDREQAPGAALLHRTLSSAVDVARVAAAGLGWTAPSSSQAASH